jgi:hypothetical protein
MSGIMTVSKVGSEARSFLAANFFAAVELLLVFVTPPFVTQFLTPFLTPFLSTREFRRRGLVLIRGRDTPF